MTPHWPQYKIYCIKSRKLLIGHKGLRAIPEKIPRGGRRQTIYFSMGGWRIHFSNYMGHWCLKKPDYMGVGFYQKIGTFDRYIELNVPVSIKISNPNLPVFLLCEIIQSTHKLIYFV